MTDIAGAKDYYASFHRREWERLETGEGRLEFEITTSLLAEALPDSGHVLDVGGGPGRYSQWLRHSGYDVTLADLSPNLLELARQQLGPGVTTEIVEADVRDLSRWPAGSFDATLAMGPFYHLTDEADRRRALREVMRVTVPGGPIAIALMSKYAFLRRTLAIPDERHRMGDAAFTAEVIGQGIFHNEIPGRFTEGHGVDPSNAVAIFEGAGLTTVVLASTHGFATGLESQIDSLRLENPAAYEETLRVLKATAADPSLLGTAGHLLYIGINPA
jgi:SAM-dependent methyltransferase